MKKYLLLLIVFISCSTNGETDINITPNLKLPYKLEIIEDYVNNDNYYVTTIEYKYDNNGKLIEVIIDEASGDIIKFNISYIQGKINNIEKYNTGQLISKYEFAYINNKVVNRKLYSTDNVLSREWAYKYNQDSKLSEITRTEFYAAPLYKTTTFEYLPQNKIKVVDEDRNMIYHFKVDSKKNPYINTINLDGLSRFYHNTLLISTNIINEKKFDINGGVIGTIQYNNEYDNDGFLVKQEYLNHSIKTTRNYSYNK